MRSLRPCLLPWILLCGAMPAWAGLKFDQVVKATTVAPDATSAEIDFSFVNDGTDPVTVERADADCSCMEVQIKGNRRIYAAGEQGVIRGRIDLSAFTGEVEKDIAVYLKGDKAKPSHRLKLKVTVPELITLEPKVLEWNTGEEAAARTVTITMHSDSPIHPQEVVPDERRNFSVTLKTVEEGKKYELTVTPHSTEQPTLAVLALPTDCPVARFKLQRIFLAVKNPPPAKAAE